MRVIVTRPQPQADDWVRRLRAEGVEAIALPLLEIGPPADAEPVREAWRKLHERALAMFVSPNAVERFFQQRPAGSAWPPGVLAGSTGPGTSSALRQAGVRPGDLVEPAAEAARFDSEALWEQLQKARDWKGASALVVRGEEGRDWLAGRLREAGAEVDFVEAYRRRAPQWDPAQKAVLEAARAAPDRHVWLFSSSEAIGLLVQRAPGADWSRARAIASHPRIAESARRAGFGQVLEVPPLPDAVARAIG